MIEKFIVITNNPLSKEKFEDIYPVEFVEGHATVVLNKVRDYIHQGYKILTHPLMSSVKPNETPYRTILISREKLKSVDYDSLSIIENAVSTTEKFIRDFDIPNWSESILKDFQLIDYDLVYHAIN